MRAVAFPLDVCGLDPFSGGSNHIVSPSDSCAVTHVKQIGVSAHGEVVTSQHPRSQLAEICEDYTDVVLFSLCLSEIHVVKILLAVK